jgi:hypothetical protein
MHIVENPKISVRGTINTLNVNEVLELAKGEYKPASVRTTVGILRENTGKGFSVSVQLEKIIITRLS